jgi:hypothetical protein
MGMVAPEQRIASAYVVVFGVYGAVSCQATQRGVCRQQIYREAAKAVAAVEGTRHRQEIKHLQRRIGELEQQVLELERRVAQAVVLDRDKQAEFACVGQAVGVSLPELHTLLDVLRPGQAPSVSQLGRWTQAAGRQARALLAVLDESTRPLVKQALADEIYVSRPVQMMVEPESLCWIVGQFCERVDGASWARHLEQLPRLEQVIHDAGSGLSKGVIELNRVRQERGLPVVADQLDHFHTLREGGRGVGRFERAAQRAWTAAEAADADWHRRRRHGQPLTVASNQRRVRWPKAEKALAAWCEHDRTWQEVKAALMVFTAEGELNTRRRAETLLAQILPRLPDREFASSKRMLQRPQTLTYLDEIQRKLEALPVPAEVRQAAVRQEGLRRRPELLRGNDVSAAARRGIWTVCTLILAKAGPSGQQAVEAVRAILRSSWRASSLVECVNSVVRMQQARHRKMTQSLLDLKRLYWNCHRFRTGRRRGQSPYQQLGIPWPEGRRWWDVLKWSPEQLRAELSHMKLAT